ncbi:MAG: membrane dipeptidase, partial [Bacteroidaceae bacterium]|nr:membrane dipeptidase [Bacteroidaceae bacterium]
MKERPVIGITANYSAAENSATLTKAYYDCVERAGGAPVLLPPTTDESTIKAQLDMLDGILFSGGGDYNPLLWGEEPSPLLGGINAERDKAELLTARLAYNRNIPMLGICRGLQTIVAAFGGRIMQDISHKATVKHSQNAVRSEATHTVRLTGGEGKVPKTLRVNSFHHQVAETVGEKLTVTAVSPDGFIEAVESSEHKPIVAVQWHPENLYDSEPESSRPYFNWLVCEASVFGKSKKIHAGFVTLDSHCDTPMTFHLGVNLNHRDENALVDFVKMKEGRMDVTNMVCYLPQPREGEHFISKNEFGISSPKAYVDFIFERIQQQVDQSNGRAAIAKTLADIENNKRKGTLSVMLGIENGLALEGDISNVEYFAEKGITYITLCHNGDNDICDSAKGVGTIGGLSEFGRQVVKEMNRLGVLIDLSHAAQSTFYDVISITEKPVVCSHSNCYSLCPHPRNITDDQMRLLAKNGGVMQITMYNGFLREDGKATVADVVKHIKHAVAVMGVDHVGIGTDLDGDGGVPGYADASDALNLTRHMIKEGFS